MRYPDGSAAIPPIGAPGLATGMRNPLTLGPARRSTRMSDSEWSDGQVGRPPFPFVVGCPRSGTTLLRAMLDTQAELAIPPESYFISKLAQHGGSFELESGFDQRLFLDALQSHKWFRRWGLDPDLTRAALRRADPADTAGAIRAVYGLYAGLRGKSRYGDKTPEYVCSIGPIAHLLPEARFVHLIRDGRDVARSLATPGIGFGIPDVGHALLFWEQRVAAGRRQGRRLGPGRYREVHYEALLEDPGSTLRDLCEFLDLDYQPSMLSFHERVEEVLKGVPGHEHHRGLARPASKGLRDWRKDMPKEELHLAEALVGATLQAFGYERLDSRPPVPTRLRALRLRVDQGRRRARKFVRTRTRVVTNRSSDAEA